MTAIKTAVIKYWVGLFIDRRFELDGLWGLSPRPINGHSSTKKKTTFINATFHFTMNSIFFTPHFQPALDMTDF